MSEATVKKHSVAYPDCLRADSTQPCTTPDYAIVDSTATVFTIYGTFIDTPSCPAYQLSSLLDACTSQLRMRRLGAEEIGQVQANEREVAYDHGSTLYEMYNSSSKKYYLEGKARATPVGVLVLQWGYLKWYVQHINDNVARTIMSCEKSTVSQAIINPHDETQPSLWKDSSGNVLAVEILKFDNHGRRMPTIKVVNGLDELSRELLLALCVGRLWATFGVPAT